MKYLLFIVLLCIGSFTATAATRPYQAALPPAGYFVSGSGLFKPDGTSQPVHGVNLIHWDNWGGAPAVKVSGAKVARLALNFTRSTSANQTLVDTYVTAGIVPIVGNWMGTCKSDAATLNSIVDTWVAQAPTWAVHFANNSLINIANEWGPSNSIVWRDSYIVAIARMRAAGYTQTLVVDSGGCGQDSQDVVKYGAAVLAADPQKNIMFDVHVYGSWHHPATAAWMQDYEKAFSAVSNSGLAVIVGEYGPGLNVGPSPTMVTPEQVIASVKQYGLVGELSWAWDDNNGPNCTSSDTGGFAMASVCGRFTGLSSELTAFGRKMVPILRDQNGLPALPGLAPAVK